MIQYERYYHMNHGGPTFSCKEAMAKSKVVGLVILRIDVAFDVI